MAFEIIIDVEPRNKEFRVEVMSDTTIEEVITTLIRRCEDEGINVSDWAKQKVGNSNVSFTMLRKSTGNTALAPTVTFGELFPDLEDRESFRLDARAQVGYLPENSLNCFVDGNSLCIVGNDFTNLQESESLFINLTKEEIEQIKKLIAKKK